MATALDTSQQYNKPLVVIVGPTASGKSSLAMKIAKAYGGEIICADSRTIYKYLDIGTAKPSAEDQATVPHWGIDLVEPGDAFSAADFKRYTTQKVQEIRNRGHVPILVGGTGLYVDGVIFDYQFGDVNGDLREALEKLSLEELHKYCYKNNIILPENSKNRRYVIRAIEQKSINNKRLRSPIDNVILVGITTDKNILRRRIEARATELFDTGMLTEALELGDKYGWESEAMTGNVYKLAHKYILNELTIEQLKQDFVTSDWRLAKRQITWLKRNPFIHWVELNDAYCFVESKMKNS